MPVKYGYSSPRWSGEILDCSMPMTFDQYSRCSFDCQYCFSYFQRSLKQFNPLFSDDEDYLLEPPEAVWPEKMRKILYCECTEKSDKQFEQYIKSRIPIQWGGLSDPFDMFEKKYGVGLEILKYFHELKYPICFSTKSCWWADDKRYVSMFNHDQWNVKVSIINMNSKSAQIMERGVPSPAERLDLIKKVSEFNAGGVTLRLRPFIIGFSDTNNEYISLIEQAAKNGANALSTEFLCIEGRVHAGLMKRYEVMSDVVGFDILDFYRRNSIVGSGYMRLNYKLKSKYIFKMRELCRKLRIRFYVSDADFKELSCNGSCCGLGKNWNYSRAQFTEVIVTARTRYETYLRQHPGDTSGAEKASRVTFDEFYSNAKDLFGFLWRHAQNFNTSGAKRRTLFYRMSMYDYIRYMWNSPNQKKSPYKYFSGSLKPVMSDSKGNLVYVYVPKPITYDAES